ncbi:hypothetical protein RDMS_01730 [Deinococcus sp. RL]|nr:hypothetical protein RDMS_01730 [Deinococcus sp. RL]
MDGAFTMAEAEEMLGLRGGGLAKNMRANGLRPKRVGKYRVMTLEQIERYERLTARPCVERVAARPRGWVGVYAAADLIGVSTAFIHKWTRRGLIAAVRVGHVNYYNPDTVREVGERLRQPAPGGWVPLRDACGGADRDSAAQWLRNRGHEVRKYMRPESGQRILYATEAAMREWQAHHAAYTRGRKLTPEQAREIRARRAAGEKRNALAREYGVSEAAIRQIVLGKTYPEAS